MASKTKWTEGPWRFGIATNGRDYIFGADGMPVARATSTRDEEKANARLIAKSPELYEALQRILKAFPLTEAHNHNQAIAQDIATGLLHSLEAE